jgi:hypothetical protein
MKMPSRPFYPGQIPPDIFGLHMPTALESETDRQKRVAQVEAGVAAAFKAATLHLDEEQARQLFHRVSRRVKRGKGKDLATDRDQRLLREYDAAAKRGETVPALARRLAAAGKDLGNTPAAIAAQIRKLLAEWKKRDRQAAVRARLWRMATYKETPTVLSLAGREK